YLSRIIVDHKHGAKYAIVKSEICSSSNKSIQLWDEKVLEKFKKQGHYIPLDVDFNNCVFVLYTNAKVEDDLKGGDLDEEQIPVPLQLANAVLHNFCDDALKEIKDKYLTGHRADSFRLIMNRNLRQSAENHLMYSESAAKVENMFEKLLFKFCYKEGNMVCFISKLWKSRTNVSEDTGIPLQIFMLAEVFVDSKYDLKLKKEYIEN
ncbi:hypothetical protein L9F63_003323, partial [Diploptera punctata]